MCWPYVLQKKTVQKIQEIHAPPVAAAAAIDYDHKEINP
jgi:hypothetical protein